MLYMIVLDRVLFSIKKNLKQKGAEQLIQNHLPAPLLLSSKLQYHFFPISQKMIFYILTFPHHAHTHE